MLVHRRMVKEDAIYTHTGTHARTHTMEDYSALKKDGMFAAM